MYPSPPRPSCSYVPTSPQILPMDMQVQICTVYEEECTSVHNCPSCNNPIHTTCGHSVDGMEGYGCAVWCVTCWIDYRETNIRQGRLKAKRGQIKQIQRMVKHSKQKIHLVEAGENVLIPIPTIDTRSPFDPQNLPGVILETKMMECFVKVLLQEYWTQCTWPASFNRQCPILYAEGCSRQTGFTSGGNSLPIVWETQDAV